MGSTIKWLLALGVGVAAGWALRSLADTPEGAGVKVLEMGIKAKNRLSDWAAVERERLDDMLAEAQSNVTREGATAGATSARTSGRKSQNSRKRDTRSARRESAQSKTAGSSVTSFNS